MSGGRIIRVPHPYQVSVILAPTFALVENYAPNFVFARETGITDGIAGTEVGGVEVVMQGAAV
jgi:hypothetical protein